MKHRIQHRVEEQNSASPRVNALTSELVEGEQDSVSIMPADQPGAVLHVPNVGYGLAASEEKSEFLCKCHNFANCEEAVVVARDGHL